MTALDIHIRVGLADDGAPESPLDRLQGFLSMTEAALRSDTAFGEVLRSLVELAVQPGLPAAGNEDAAYANEVMRATAEALGAPFAAPEELPGIAATLRDYFESQLEKAGQDPLPDTGEPAP